jgi:ABC-2 type transport system permease protein
MCFYQLPESKPMIKLSWPRIQAVMLHSWYHATHSMETWMDLLWFSFFGTLLFGFMMVFFAQGSKEVAQGILLGMFFWEVVRVGQYSLTISIMWEIWSKSFSSFFISPLTMTEMMIGQMIAGAVKTTIVAALVSLVSYFCFGFSIAPLGLMMIFYFICLLGFAYAAGVFITGLILRYGTDIQSLGWALIFMFQPLSAVFYPVEVLPKSIQWFAYLSPITYVMEAARAQYFRGELVGSMLLGAVISTVIYIALAWWYFISMYQRSRRTGSFARLGN